MSTTCGLGINSSLMGWICVSRLLGPSTSERGRAAEGKEEHTRRTGRSCQEQNVGGGGEGVRTFNKAGRQGGSILRRAEMARLNKGEPLSYSDDKMVFLDQFYRGII